MSKKTKIFCDIAEINLIRKFNKKKIVQGFTTNPSLMRKAGAKNYEDYSRKILKICNNKPVSIEVFADNPDAIIKQAVLISKWAKNVYVKIPIINSKGKFLGKVIKELNKKNINLNITAVYTSKQTKKILNNINKKSKVIISIFAGRMADVGKNPIPEIKKSIDLAKKYNIAPSTFANAYVNDRPFVTSNIIGATTIEQLRENIDSIDITLSNEILHEIEDIHLSDPNPCV